MAPGEGPNITVEGTLIVSLRSANCRFLSHLECVGQKVTIFAHSGIAYGCAQRNLQEKNALTLTKQISDEPILR